MAFVRTIKAVEGLKVQIGLTAEEYVQLGDSYLQLVAGDEGFEGGSVVEIRLSAGQG
jgi:hypothetical protein